MDLCHDYSFWQPPIRCSNNSDLLDEKSHASLCNRDGIDCTKTRTSRKSFCQNTSSEESCWSKRNFFCNLSKTCLPKGKFSLFFHIEIMI